MSSNNIDQNSSNGMKWLLLVSSLVVLILLIMTAASVFFTEWRHHQSEYRKLLLAKASDKQGRDSARAYAVRLQQVVVPELNVTDRCVSCHTGIDDPRMTKERQPYRSHPGDLLENHPISKFGCTTCHRGQGRAVTYKDAKSVHSFWDYPMLPKEYAQASCGHCHDPISLEKRGGDVLARGARLFESSGCRSCHKLGGRGGSLGIALDDEGQRIIHQLPLTDMKGEHTVWNWLAEHFRDPQAVVPTSQMRNPTLTEPEIRALTTYMLSLSKVTLPKEYIARDKHLQTYAAIAPSKPDGANLYKQFCFSCHESGSYSRWDKTFKRFIPAIRGAGLASSPEGYLERNINSGREGTQMSGWQQQAGGLSDIEVKAIVSYLKAGRKPAQSNAALVRRGSSVNGKAIYAQNCQGCHGAAGTGGIAPVLASRTFQEASTDTFIASTIRDGRPDTAMPAFQRAGKAGLTDPEVGDLLAYIRSMK